MEEGRKALLADRLLADWLDEKEQSLAIVNNVDLGGGDPDKINWAIQRAYSAAPAAPATNGHQGG